MGKYVAGLTFLILVIAVYGRDLSGCSVRCNTYFHDPICAYNGKEYRMFQNSCLMLTQNCGAENPWIQHPVTDCDAESRLKRMAECPKICPMNYAPICGTNGKTNRVFSNQCEMDVANCMSSMRWITTRASVCGLDSMFETVP